MSYFFQLHSFLVLGQVTSKYVFFCEHAFQSQSFSFLNHTHNNNNITQSSRVGHCHDITGTPIK